MLNITDLEQEQKKPPLLRLAFRPFFLFGSIFSILALVLWGLSLSGSMAGFHPVGGWFWWHGHEMVFGFGVAIIIGFLLTAVQNWSGIPGLSGYPLAGLFACWLAGRLLLLFPVVPLQVVATVDTAFLPIAAYALSRPIIAARLWRNLIFVPLLVVLAVINGHSYLQLMSGGISSLPDTQLAILIITLLIVIMGGRVIPFFTANATQTQKPEPVKWLEVLSIFSLVLVVLYQTIAGSIAPDVISGALLLVAGVASLIRLSRWQGLLTLTNPLLWSLHLSYLLICLSLGLLGLCYFGVSVPISAALHGLTVGGMGLMVLAMISRVSLGHTGRILQVGRWVTLGYAAVAIAAVLRVVAPLLSSQPITFYLISIGGWVVGYTAFIVVYWPVLTKPRVDGRPG